MSETHSSCFGCFGLAILAWLALGYSHSFAAVVLLLLFYYAFVPGFGHKGPVQTKSQHQHTTAVQPQGYQDPLRWTFLPSNGVQRANTLEPSTYENDLCVLKCLAMHRPTHEPWREAAGNYPYAWHLHGRKRLWEIRVQMRLKEVPKSKLYFGIELADCEAASATARQMKAVLIRAVQGVIGDFYYSDGEDPSEVMPGEEVEPSTFVMPLWAFDQFMVSEAGEEPEITGDLTNVGMLRKDGLKAYAKELQKCINEFSKDKVYTFCIWGISQFLDCIRWEVGGIFPGMTANFSRFGLKVINIAIYEMPGEHPDARHLRSRKRYFLNVAMWSILHSPEKRLLDEFLGPDEIEETKPQSPRAMDVFACCSGLSRVRL
ncbi:Hypothetical protein SCF082_LOCUS25572 [Durusdinium trenchii]|uniref:Domain of unknown function at the cortex 1 domain-containing protein n=1 Tax=Durusdinium trenchii TaxID=1381693 RepID=A0ABP0M389_9DINO